MRAGLNEKHEPARLTLLLGIASLRPPNQKRSDLFNPSQFKLATLRDLYPSRELGVFLSPLAPPANFAVFLETIELSKSFRDGTLSPKKPRSLDT